MAVEVMFGALCDPLHVQFNLTKRACAHYQADADAITRLSVRGLMSESETAKARKRLVKAIALGIGNQVCTNAH